MRFENTFEVAGTPGQVMALFEDLPVMASFLPGAILGERNPDGSYPASLSVAFGPKRLTFKGRLTHEPNPADLSGRVTGQASADLRGAKMSVTMEYRLGASLSGTTVTLQSDSELTGMLAEFARTGGVPIAEALIADFANRFSAHAAATAAPGGAAAIPPPATGALSVSRLLALVLRSALSSVWRRPSR